MLLAVCSINPFAELNAPDAALSKRHNNHINNFFKDGKMNITEFKAFLKRKELAEMAVEYEDYGKIATVIINKKMINVDICEDSNIKEKVAEAGSWLRIEQIGNKNAYIYHCQNGRVYVSYSTPMAVYLDNSRMPSLRRDYKDFSTTTSHHVSVFKEIMGYPDVQYVRGA